MHGRRGHGHGFGPRGRHRFPNREEWLRRLEEYQRDLEEEAADVADIIRRLKQGEPGTTASA
jgi:ADP-dependent phosphofructokinase/glucokinase